MFNYYVLAKAQADGIVPTANTQDFKFYNLFAKQEYNWQAKFACVQYYTIQYKCLNRNTIGKKVKIVSLSGVPR